jgi:putative flippase GtrA
VPARLDRGATAAMSKTRQFTRFALVGVLTNAALYALYLGLTIIGVGPKAAMTAAFGTGVVVSYLFNRHWTFEHTGALTTSAPRYAGTYVIAYLVNVVSLVLLVDIAELPHEAVMLALIVGTALLTFTLQRLWVFDAAERRP